MINKKCKNASVEKNKSKHEKSPRYACFNRAQNSKPGINQKIEIYIF
jgi:hypothetical protein